jgi:hypothetical protein
MSHNDIQIAKKYLQPWSNCAKQSHKPAVRCQLYYHNTASQHSKWLAGWLWHEELKKRSFDAEEIPTHDNIQSNTPGRALGRQWL